MIQIFHNIADIFREFFRYANRECSVCGKYVPKGEGYESFSSFQVAHEICLFPERKDSNTSERL